MESTVFAIILMFLGLPLIVLSIPLTLIWGNHKRKLLEMRLRHETQGDLKLQAQIEALRADIQSLRDTSMQYDLSFETALQRVETRVQSLEAQRIANSSSLPQISHGE